MPINRLLDKVLERPAQRQMPKGRQGDFEIAGRAEANMFRRRTLKLYMDCFELGETLEHEDKLG